MRLHGVPVWSTPRTTPPSRPLSAVMSSAPCASEFPSRIEGRVARLVVTAPSCVLLGV